MFQTQRSSLEGVMRHVPPMRPMLRRCALAILIVVPGSIVRAQPPMAPGTRVRVSVAPPGAAEQAPWRVGRFLSRTPTTFVIDTGNAREPIGIAIGTIRQIDVSRGRPSRRWTGAVIGGLVSGRRLRGAGLRVQQRVVQRRRQCRRVPRVLRGRRHSRRDRRRRDRVPAPRRRALAAGLGAAASGLAHSVMDDSSSG